MPRYARFGVRRLVAQSFILHWLVFPGLLEPTLALQSLAPRGSASFTPSGAGRPSLHARRFGTVRPAPHATNARNDESSKTIKRRSANVLSCFSIRMQTQILSPSARLLPPPAVLLYPLLQPPTSSATTPNDSSNAAPEKLPVRATQITVVLSQILDYKGYYHGGLNE